MGWGHTLMLGGWGFQKDIRANQRELARLGRQISAKRRRLGSLDAEVERLSGELDECKLYIAALSRALVDRGMLDEAELSSLVDAVDTVVDPAE